MKRLLSSIGTFCLTCSLNSSIAKTQTNRFLITGSCDKTHLRVNSSIVLSTERDLFDANLIVKISVYNNYDRVWKRGSEF